MRPRLLGGAVLALVVISLAAVVIWARSTRETAQVVTEEPPPTPVATSTGTPTPFASPSPGAPDPVTAAPVPVRSWTAEPGRSDRSRTSPGQPSPTPVGSVAGQGARLRIPSLAVDARIESAEIREGVFQVPADPAVIGVHRGEARDLPARLASGPGTVLMSGHVTSGRARGALWPLHRLAPGAELQTSDGAGRLIRWRATGLRTVPADELPADLLDRSGPQRLVLVTCSGEVETVNGQRRYRDNLLVEAVPLG